MTDILDHILMVLFEFTLPLSNLIAGNPILDWGFYVAGVSACTYLLWVASYHWRYGVL